MEVEYDGVSADDDHYLKGTKLEKDQLLALATQCCAARNFTPLPVQEILFMLSERLRLSVHKLMPFVKDALDHGIRSGYLKLNHGKVTILLEKHHPRVNNQNPSKQVQYY